MDGKVKSNLTYSFLYQGLAIILPLITTPYISRVLGPTLVGEYSYAYSIGYYFVLATMLGLNNYGNRSIAAVRDDADLLSKEFSSIYALQLITGLLSTVAYVGYAFFLSNNPMTWILLIYVASAILDVNWFFFGMEQFKLTVTRNMLLKIASTVCVFIFVKTPKDIYVYAAILVITIALSNIALFPFLHRFIRFTRISANDIIRHIKPNLVLFVPILAIGLYKVMDKVMLGVLTTKNEVGLYESAERIIQVPMGLIQAMGTVMMPRMTNLLARQKDSAESYFAGSVKLAMFLATSLCFGIMGVARYFVPWYYGEQYAKCIDLFQILMPSCIFLAFANVVRTQYLIPRKKDKIYIKSVLLGALVNLSINMLLISDLESLGAAVGTLVAEAVVCIYQVVAIRKEFEVKKYIKIITPHMVSGIIMYIVCMMLDMPWTNFINMVTLVLIGALVYISILAIQKILLHHRKGAR